MSCNLPASHRNTKCWTWVHWVAYNRLFLIPFSISHPISMKLKERERQKLKGKKNHDSWSRLTYFSSLKIGAWLDFCCWPHHFRRCYVKNLGLHRVRWAAVPSISNDFEEATHFGSFLFLLSNIKMSIYSGEMEREMSRKLTEWEPLIVIVISPILTPFDYFRGACRITYLSEKGAEKGKRDLILLVLLFIQLHQWPRYPPFTIRMHKRSLVSLKTSLLSNQIHWSNSRKPSLTKSRSV